MKKIYLLFIVLFGLNLQGQIINIPDSDFKIKLLDASPTNTIAKDLSGNYFKIDSNNDGEIQVSEALNVSYLDVNFDYQDYFNQMITSLEGISSFTNLIYLKCSYNNLNSINISSLTLLQGLECNGNQLSTLNIENLINLQTLNCFGNQITILNIDSLNSLKELNCSGNQLTSLNITTLTNLETLNLSSNPITAIDLQGLTNLKNLYCNGNSITTLNLQGLINLLNLYCNNNSITTLNLEGLSNLKYFQCSNNQITTLNLQGLTNLEALICTDNSQLTSINLQGLTNLEALYCSNNQLSDIDIQGLVSLYTFTCSDNQLTYLNAQGLNNLQYLTCKNNQITVLNLQGLTSLVLLYCENNQLTNLDVHGLTNLDTLFCNNNLLNTLELQDNDLQYLRCNSNQLNSIYVKNGNNEVELIFSDNPNLQYICCDESQIQDIQNLVITNGQNCHVNSYCSFTPGGTYYQIVGNIKYDLNNNGCDISDINYSNLNFSIANGTNSGSLISNQLGNYNIPVQSGSHTITPNLENPTYFNISPPSFTVDFPTQASPFTQDFCVTANGIHSDVEVVVFPTVPARPGFDAKYKISYRNKGNQIENGSVSLTFDDTVLDYVSSNPVFNSTATNSYTWNYTNLQPFETREIEVVFNVNSPTETPAVNIDDVLNYTVTIATSNTDETPNDNSFTLNQTVVGSYDPNDKTCLEGKTVSPDMIGEYVHYIIRFENTGTFPAENVVVKDMIDLAKFDLATLIPLKGSHDYYTKIKDNKVEFIFENINLDFNDATNDGYVSFKIKTKSNLVVGDTFSNNANIYFDYNFPITTNTYTTTIQALSTQDFDFGKQFTLYPNPVKDVLHFNSKENLTIQSVEIYNMLGQVVLVVPNATTSIDVSSLTKGNYFVKVNTEKGSGNTKFIKE